MFHNIEAGRIAEQPAREHRPPGRLFACLRAFLDEHLDEGPGFGGLFPGQRALASGEAQDHISESLRLAGLERHELGEVVALVEQTERGDTVLDRCSIIAFDRRRPGGTRGNGLGNVGSQGVGLVAIARAGRKQAQHRQQGDDRAHDAAAQAGFSGDQAS